MGKFLNNSLGVNNSYQAGSAPISRQTDLVDQINASNGQVNSVMSSQGNLAGQLQNMANGQGPNPAQTMLNQATNRNIQQNAGMLASQRGLSPALAQRLIAQNSANMSQQGAGQGALMGAQQQMGALGQLAGVYGQQQQGALGMNSNLQNALASQNNAAVGMQSNMNNANLQASLANQGMAGKMVGGVMQGMSSGASMMGSMFGAAHGGTVPDWKDQLVQKFDIGGTVMPSWGYNDHPMVESTPTSIAGKLLDEGMNTIEHGASALMNPKQENAQGPTADSPMAGGPMDSMSSGSVSPGGEMGGGIGGISTMLASDGGKVPGQAPFGGDDPKNDIVPAKLSPGEIVIPRSIMMSNDPAGNAAKFVQQEISKKNAQQPNFADGGQVPSALSMDPPQQSFGLPDQYISNPKSQGEQDYDSFYKQINSGGPTGFEDSQRRMALDLAEQAQGSRARAAESSVENQNGPREAMMAENQKRASLGMSPLPVPGGAAPEQADMGPDDSSGPATLPQPAQASGGASNGGGGSGTIDNYLKTQESMYDDKTKRNADIQNDYSQKNWNLDVERENAMNDYRNSKIDPKHVFKTMGTGEKIGTLVGLLFGGVGGALTGSPNAGLEILNKKIDQDIDAQKQDQAKSLNLLNANHQAHQDLRLATEMTRVMQRDAFADEIQKQAVSTKNPMAKLQATSLYNGLMLQNEQSMAQMKMWQDVRRGGAAGGSSMDQHLQMLRMTNPAMAKEIEGRLVPGVGLASVPLEGKVREEMVSRKDLQDQVGNLRAWAKQHQGSLKPADIAYGKALANTVQDAYRRANGQGVFREAEAHFVKGIVEADPTKFFNAYRVDPKYRALEDSNKMALDGLYRGYGVKPMGQSQQQGAPQAIRSFKPMKRAK